MFEAMIDSLFTDPVLGRAATYWPSAGGVESVRVIRRRDSTPAPLLETTMKRPAMLFDVRVSEVATPAKGDLLQVVGETGVFIVRDFREDCERLVWLLDVEPI
jgi:hypothetical protein